MTVIKITRPAMIEVLKDSTRCLTQMNKKQMLEIIDQKGLLEQARNLIKEGKQKKEKEVKLVDILTGEETIFNSLVKASRKTGKGVLFLKYNNGRTWNNKKIIIELILLL